MWAAVATLYAAVTLWMTRPLIGSAFSAVAGWPGDNLYFTWLVNWYHQSIALGQLPVRVPTLNVPEGWNIAYNEMTPTMALLGIPGFFGGASRSRTTSRFGCRSF